MDLSEFVKEKATNKLSASRLLLLLWGIGVLIIWAITSLKTGVLAVIPDSVVTVLGIVVGGKTVQRFGEK
jgi:hypothetical protein